MAPGRRNLLAMIDCDKLKAACHGLDGQTLTMILERALDHVPAEHLPSLIKGCGQQIEGADLARHSLLTDVREFHEKSLKGHYQDKHFSYKSIGQGHPATTLEWLATCRRLFQRCAALESGPNAETLQAYDLLFELLEELDDGELVSWDDEGGSYELSLTWTEILPPYFACLSPTLSASDYTTRVLDVLRFGNNYERELYLQAARDYATPDQQAELTL